MKTETDYKDTAMAIGEAYPKAITQDAVSEYSQTVIDRIAAAFAAGGDIQTECFKIAMDTHLEGYREGSERAVQILKADINRTYGKVAAREPFPRREPPSGRET